MRALLLALCTSFAALASPAQDAQALQESGRALLESNQFEAALQKFEAANRLESTPERLLAIAQCHRELAFESAREAAQRQPTEQTMRALAGALDDLQAPLPPAPEPPPLARPRAPSLSTAAPRPEAGERTPPSARKKLLIAAGIGSAVLFAASGAAYLHASSLTGGLSDPNYPDKTGLQGQINTWQTGSNMLLGAGLFLGAVTAGLLAVRF
jgi:hypothetical protein